VVAFTRRVPVRHGDHLEGTFRRPLTSCAHRLRKPDRTYELLALSVARWTRRCGLRPAAPSTPKGGLRLTTAPLRGAMSRHLPPRQVARCRRRFRTTTTRRTRAPSVGSTRTLRPERAQPRLLFTRTASPRTLSLAASLGLPRQRPTGRLELSHASRGPPCCFQHGGAALRREKDASHRLLQPTPVTSTLRTARFLVAPYRAPRLAASRASSCDEGALTHPGPEPGGGRVWDPCHPLAR